MAIRLICVCGRGMALPEKYAGQHVQCPDCHAMLRIPSSEENVALTRWICKCGQRLKARSRTGGKKLRCPNCSSEVAVPFADGHSTFVEENFLLDDASGVVQRIREKPREEIEIPTEPIRSASPPPPKNLLSPATQDRVTPKTPAPKPKTAATEPREGRSTAPEVVLDDDDEQTTLRERGSTPLADVRPAPAKDKPDAVYDGSGTPPLSVEVEPPTAPAVRPQPAPQYARERYAAPLAAGGFTAGPARPAKPEAATPQPAPVAQADEEESWAEVEEDEGINAPELAAYFNTKTGVEAAKAGIVQVLHGYWLYIPYALLVACIYNITQLALGATEGNSAAAVVWLALPGIFSLFLWAGFVACVKDGVFERSMGIERMLYNAAAHFVRFGITALMMVPVGLGIALVMAAVIARFWGPSPLAIRIVILALTFAAGLFALALLLMPPVISVLEHREPFSSLGRGLVFSLRHIWDLFTITLVSMFVGAGLAGVVYFFWKLSELLLYFTLPPWLFESLRQFFGGLFSAAIMGHLVASLTLLYLSHIGDEARLQEIQNRLRGPAAVPVRLYVAIGAASIVLLALNYFRVQPRSVTTPPDAAPASDPSSLGGVPAPPTAP